MTRLGQVVFAALVLAAFGAFFAAQQLKSQPSVIGRFHLKWPVISPNADGRNDLQRISFRLKQADRVDVAILDDGGDEVREIASGRRLAAYRFPKPSFTWDGTDGRGRPVADGTYRVRITLREQGRNVVIQDAFAVDRTPPTVRVLSVGPQKAVGPELLPHSDGAPARISLNAPLRRGRLLVFRTWPRPLTLVREIPIAPGRRLAEWDGRDQRGAPAPPGPYLAVAEGRDVAGNIGSSVPLTRAGLPQTPFGRRLPGHGGITVRRLAVQGPLLPVVVGERATLAVDARRERYRWSVRRVGSPVVARRGTAGRALIAVKAPARSSGLFVFTAEHGRRSVGAPFVVDDPQPHTALVVAPLSTWQGRNPVDDDGDGLPDLLADGRGVKLRRVQASPLPSGFAAQQAPIFSWLDRGGHHYDATTDIALAIGSGPKLAGHRGVLLAGDEVWLPPALQRALRRFVERGGTLLSAGTDSLQRQARLTAYPRLVDPTPRASADLFGSRLAPVTRGRFDLTGTGDQIELFRGTAGTFSGYTLAEPTAARGPGKLVAAAVTPAGRAVIVALRVGKGLVIRFGLPELPGRLASSAEAQGLMERAWELLSR